MKVEEIVQSIYEANWILSDEFEIEIDNDTNKITQDIWNMSVISFSMPEFSAGEGESILGGIRKLSSRINNALRFTISFRDIGHADLSKYFQTKFALQQKLYFDQISTKINIYHLNSSEEKRVLLFSTEAIITNISGMTFNNSESNIQEFTVSFTASVFTSNSLNDFGGDFFDIDIIDGIADRF